MDPSSHLAELDALRGLAVLQVVFHHAGGRWLGYTGIPLTVPMLDIDGRALLSFGGVGVPLFFLLSGYLLSWIESDRQQREGYSLRSYFLRRIFRLAPAYYVAIIAYLLFWPQPVGATDVLAHASFLHSLFPSTTVTVNPAFWTLTSEAIFYCLLPFIVLKMRRLWQRLALFGVLFTVSLSTRFYILWSSPSQTEEGFANLYLQFLPSTVLYLFLAGILLQELVKRQNIGSLRSVWQPRFATFLFLTSALCLLVILPLNIGSSMLVGVVPMTAVKELLVIALFSSAVLGSPLFRKILSWKPLAFIGLISYSLYLFHNLVIVFAKDIFLSPLRSVPPEGASGTWMAFSVYMLFVLLATGAISYLSYRFVESPFMRYKPK